VALQGKTLDCVVALFGCKETRSEQGLLVCKKGRVLGKLKPVLALPLVKELTLIQQEGGFELRWKDEVCCSLQVHTPVLTDLVTSRLAQMSRYQKEPFGPGCCTHKWIWYYAELFPAVLQGSSLPHVEASASDLMPEHYDSEIMDTFIRQQLRAREHEFTRFHNLSVFAGTWNCGGTPPRAHLTSWLSHGCNPDLVFLGLQETCKLQATTTVLGDPERSQQWRAFLEEEVSLAFPGEQYVCIETFDLVGMLLLVLAKSALYPHIPRDKIDVCIAKCGLKGRTGNKGGIGARFQVFDTTVCVVNAHLAAFSDNILERNAQFQRIARKLRFRNAEKPLKLYEHDLIVWLGDLNYRLSQLSFDEILGLIQARRFDLLLRHDQLRQEIRKKCAFSDFQEAEISFPPSYKFRVDNSSYDQEKRREPAWCDRILWRGDLQPLNYSCVLDIQQSDHRPVFALFALQAKACDTEALRRAKVEVLRQIDTVHMQWQPQAQVSVTGVVIAGVGYKQPRTAELQIANAGQGLLEFKFREGLDGKIAHSWLGISPFKGAVAQGKTVTITLTAYITEKEARKAYYEPDYLSCVLVLSVLGGSDHFIDVRCEYLGSAFGSSCYDLVKVLGPVTDQQGKPQETSSELAVPKELWRLLEFIVEKGASVPGLFSETGTPEGWMAVRRALDAHTELEADVYSACNVLLELLHSLSVPVLPLAILDCFCNLYVTEGGRNQELASSFILSLPPVAARCFVAVAAFLRELLAHKESNRLTTARLVGLFTDALTQSARITKSSAELTDEQWRALHLRRLHRYCFISLYLA
jgi:phosphatidylinositol-bisphosphatase